MRILAIVLILLPLLSCTRLHQETETPSLSPSARGAQWALSTGHPIASQIGADVLARGGNAVDATVAVSFALAVVLPQAGNIGGGFFAVGSRHGQENSDPWMIDARETAPHAVTPGTFLELPPGSALRGPYASGTPGTVAGLAAMHEVYGSLPWDSLVEPAIHLARDGFRMNEGFVNLLGRFGDKLRADPNAAEIFFAEDPEVGRLFRQPDLARTLARIAQDPADFYTGETARLIVEDAVAYGSPITAGDLAAYRAEWRDPVACSYRGWDIVSAAPPSAGGAILCQTAQTLAPFDLSALEPQGVQHTHYTAQAWGRAFHDRDLLGDPAFIDMAVLDRLISPAYGAEIARRIQASDSAVTEPADPRREPLETTHFSIVDGDGNAVSVTTTLNGAYGNGHVVAGAGFLMNNEMDDFNTRPGEPNLYGLVQGEANIPEPGKRMLSSMSPTLLYREGQLMAVLGTPGGSTIPTTLWHLLNRMIDHGWSLDRAMAIPRYHYQGTPDSIMVEPGMFDGEVSASLEDLGYELRERGRTYGNVYAVSWDQGRGEWVALGDPRGSGLPLAQ